jgi:hypothetical protein
VIKAPCSSSGSAGPSRDRLRGVYHLLEFEGAIIDMTRYDHPDSGLKRSKKFPKG